MGSRAILKSYTGWIGAAGYILLFLALLIFSLYNTDSEAGIVRSVQNDFLQVEISANRSLNKLAGTHSADPGPVINRSEYPAFYYRNDSLLAWNTNLLPVSPIADLHFPQNGVLQLQNGWYYAVVKQLHAEKFALAIPLSAHYPYQNSELVNRLSESLGAVSAEIQPPTPELPSIRNAAGRIVFSLKLSPPSNDRIAVLAIGWLLFILLSWWFLQRTLPRKSVIQFAFLFVSFGALYWFGRSVHISAALFDPSVLAFSTALPNMYCVLVVLIFAGCLIHSITLLATGSPFFKWLGLVVVCTAVPLFEVLIRALVINSSVPLAIDRLFSLKLLSFIIIALMGIGGLVVYRLIRITSLGFSAPALAIVSIAVLAFATLLKIPVELNLGSVALLIICWYRTSTRLSSLLTLILLFSVWSTAALITWSSEKELEERDLYLNQLSEDRDPAVDLEFTSASQQLRSEPVISRLLNTDSVIGPDDLKDVLERRVFNSFWERYDFDFFVYRGADSGFAYNGKRKEELDQLIAQHGEKSEIDSNLWFIRDYTSQFSYVFRLKIDSTLLIGTLKSKRIPEEIGFPRLLISDQANVFESLRNYSIAKYYKGNLISQFGVYRFPTRLSSFFKGKKILNERELTDKSFHHLQLRKTRDDILIMSLERSDWVDKLTAVAFLLIFFTMLTALMWVLTSGVKTVALRDMSFAVKIQLLLVGMVFLSLVVFSLASSEFVRRQYGRYTSDMLREKVHSVNTVAGFRLGSLDSITQRLKSNDLSYHLSNWSRIFVTDVNIYDTNGHLVRSSQPKIYNYGLIGEQMNAEAVQALIRNHASEFTHQEEIGLLKYFSAYMPLMNDKGKLLGYINLQHFDKQNAFETQIVQLLSSIINVFLLLLVLSLAFTIAASSWITAPVRRIRAKLANVEFGKRNDPLEVVANDEIGQLVAAYNSKLVELELAAEKLAVSERESAWREMARQVAHEIKNPLTPMKLSLQQLLRVYDANDPDSGERVKRVGNSLLEQIDTLAAIANSFSSFASLPAPQNEHIELKELLVKITTLFDGQNFTLSVIYPPEPVWINGDSDMLGRVFLNVIRNAEQAIRQAGDKGRIEITLSVHDSLARIDIKDNGVGIEPDLRSRIFEPYFTTKSSGTGLGLAMVKQIVESHNGTIQLLAGSPVVFRIELPLAE